MDGTEAGRCIGGGNGFGFYSQKWGGSTAGVQAEKLGCPNLHYQEHFDGNVKNTL